MMAMLDTHEKKKGSEVKKGVQNEVNEGREERRNQEKTRSGFGYLVTNSRRGGMSERYPVNDRDLGFKAVPVPKSVREHSKETVGFRETDQYG
jgi:hypothetical protein